MPKAIQVIVALNVVLTAALGFLAYSIGGGFTSGVFPPNEARTLTLTERLPRPDPSTRAREGVASQPSRVPDEFQRADLVHRPWETRVDTAAGVLR